VGAASTDFDTTVIVDRALVHRVRTLQAVRINGGERDRIAQARMVPLLARQVARAALADRAGDLLRGDPWLC
jgi:hypothetical protein